MKKTLTKVLFIAALPLFMLGVVGDVIVKEIAQASRAIRLELRIEFSSLRDIWKDL